MSEHTLHTTEIKRLERSRTDKILAGVSGGLGRYFDLSPAVFRLGFVVLTLLGGAGILVYVTAVLVIPKEGEDRSIAEDILANRRDHPARLVALAIVGVAVLSLLARADTWPAAGTAWCLLVIAGLIFLWTSKGRGRGLAIAVLTFLTLLFVTAIAAVAAAFAWFDVSLSDGVGNHSYTPTSVAVASQGYKLGIGKLELDLTRLPAGRPASVSAEVGMGELKIVVPRGVPLLVTSHVKAGDLDVLGQHEEGTNVRLVSGNGSELTVVTNVGAGHIEVVRGS